MTETANSYTKQGLQLVQNGRLSEAIDFFSKAIELDPDCASAYHHRGETYMLLNRIVEGNTDLQRAKDIQSGKRRPAKSNKPSEKTKVSINEVESIYDTIFPANFPGRDEDPFEFDDSFYDYVFSDDALESDEAWGGIMQEEQEFSEPESFPAVIEFLGGDREEVIGAILFQPTQEDVSLIRKDGYVERVIPLEQLACIRMTGAPGAPQYVESSCHIEIIETIDGSIFHEAISPDQIRDNILLGFSTKEQTRYTYTVIPKVNIKKRCQQRFLGDILLEKRFIAGDILKRALNEHMQEKSLKLGKIIAQNTKILYSKIEEELEKASQGSTKGLKTGEILLAAGLVNENQVLDALEQQEHMQNMRIGEFLIEKGIIQEKEVYMALAEKFRTQFIDLRKQKVSKKTLAYLPREIVLKHEILPISLDEDGVLTVATIQPGITSLCETILKESKCQMVRCVLAQPTHLRNIINLLYKKIGLGK